MARCTVPVAKDWDSAPAASASRPNVRSQARHALAAGRTSAAAANVLDSSLRPLLLSPRSSSRRRGGRGGRALLLYAAALSKPRRRCRGPARDRAPRRRGVRACQPARSRWRRSGRPDLRTEPVPLCPWCGTPRRETHVWRVRGRSPRGDESSFGVSAVHSVCSVRRQAGRRGAWAFHQPVGTWVASRPVVGFRSGGAAWRCLARITRR
jgi:hypothetical protein